MHAVVDRAIGHVVADVRGQQTHDLEFGEGQIDVGIVPEGAADPRLQHQPAAMEIVDTRARWASSTEFDDHPQPMRQDGHAARLVDEVERAAIEGEMLVGRLRAAGQEDHGQGDALAAQPRQQVDARDAGQAPVEHDHVGRRCRRPPRPAARRRRRSSPPRSRGRSARAHALRGSRRRRRRR